MDARYSVPYRTLRLGVELYTGDVIIVWTKALPFWMVQAQMKYIPTNLILQGFWNIQPTSKFCPNIIIYRRVFTIILQKAFTIMLQSPSHENQQLSYRPFFQVSSCRPMPSIGEDKNATTSHNASADQFLQQSNRWQSVRKFVLEYTIQNQSHGCPRY